MKLSSSGVLDRIWNQWRYLAETKGQPDPELGRKNVLEGEGQLEPDDTLTKRGSAAMGNSILSESVVIVDPQTVKGNIGELWDGGSLRSAGSSVDPDSSSTGQESISLKPNGRILGLDDVVFTGDCPPLLASLGQPLGADSTVGAAVCFVVGATAALVIFAIELVHDNLFRGGTNYDRNNFVI